jgi:hypothetical protein
MFSPMRATCTINLINLVLVILIILARNANYEGRHYLLFIPILLLPLRLKLSRPHSPDVLSVGPKLEECKKFCPLRHGVMCSGSSFGGTSPPPPSETCTSLRLETNRI